MARLAARRSLSRPVEPRTVATPDGNRREGARLSAIGDWLAARPRVRPDTGPLRALPLYGQFICIARHESGVRWNANDGNGYYGALQMDIEFQRTYAPRLLREKGTADRWTPSEQIRAAARAVPGRGFSPWPNTARMCGLL